MHNSSANRQLKHSNYFFLLNISLEHTTGLCKSYEDKHVALREKLRETSLRCKYFCPSYSRKKRKLMMAAAGKLMTEHWHSALWSVGRLDSVSWRVDYTLSSSELREVNQPTIQLKLQRQGAESGAPETTVVSVSADKFRVLLAGKFSIF